MPAQLPFLQVDAFTTRPYAGNPCAVVFEADGLTTDQMQAVAAEFNHSETSFVLRSSRADVRARYFTPAEEIPLAGHPTIATLFALVTTGRLALQGPATTFQLELQVGPIPVEVIARDGRVERVVMSQKKPRFLQTYDPARVLPVFGLGPGDLLPGLPIQTVSTGTPQLMVPLQSPESLRRIRVDPAAYLSLRESADFFSPHLFCLEGITPAGRTFARHFGVPPDTPEDPFTGSATGGMGAYLWRYGLIEQPEFLAEQGHWMDRPGQAWVQVAGSPQDIETVRVGGPAVAVLRGELSVPDGARPGTRQV